MFKLDENDPIDRLIIKELCGEPIPFDEWEDLWDELEDEPDAEERLRANGYTIERGLQEGELYRAEFFQLLEKYALPADNRLKLCYRMAEQAIDAPSDDLIYVYCATLFEAGFLLDQDREDFQGADGALAYLNLLTSTSDLYNELKRRISVRERFLELLPKIQKNSLPKTGCDVSRKHAVFQAYQKFFAASRNGAMLLHNIEYLLQISAGSAELHSIEPLFIYQAMMKHDKRLHSSDTLSMDFEKLWKHKAYQIEHDNGKNFKKNRARIAFFAELCNLYQDDETVDLPVCLYGFDKLSNLGDFYRAEMMLKNFPGPPDTLLDLPETPEETIEYNLFSCFEKGGRNVILESDSSLTEKMLDKFRRHSDYRRALNKIERYITQHEEELAEAYWGADDHDVKVLCSEIFEKTSLPARWKPKTIQEISLFLAAINACLMELVDDFADRLLTLTAGALLGESS